MSSWSDGNQINTDGDVVGRLGMKPTGYVVWVNGSYYEAVDAYGKIAYGGSGDAGGASGTSGTAVIQAALDGLTTGGTVFVKHGTYTGTNLTWPSITGLILAGEDAYNTKITTATAGSYLVDFDEDAQQGHCRDIWFDGAGNVSTVLDMSRSAATTSRPFYLTDCRVTDAKDEANSKLINTTHREELVVNNCYLSGLKTTGQARYGIYYQESAGFLHLINHTTIDNCSTAGVYVDNVGVLDATQCQFNCSTGAVKLQLGDSVRAFLVNCHFENNARDAIQGVNSAVDPSLYLTSCFVQGQVYGYFQHLGIHNCRFNVSAGYNLDIDGLSHAAYGTGHFLNGVDMASGLQYQFYDYETQRWLSSVSHRIEAHTANDTLTVGESGSIHTNLGATGTITLTLPQDAIAGTTFEFAVMTAQALRIDPGAAGAIYIGGAKQTDDKYIWADDEGESVKLVEDGNGDWVALYTQGTWGVEA